MLPPNNNDAYARNGNAFDNRNGAAAYPYGPQAPPIGPRPPPFAPSPAWPPATPRGRAAAAAYPRENVRMPPAHVPSPAMSPFVFVPGIGLVPIAPLPPGGFAMVRIFRFDFNAKL